MIENISNLFQVILQEIRFYFGSDSDLIKVNYRGSPYLLIHLKKKKLIKNHAQVCLFFLLQQHDSNEPNDSACQKS